MKLYLKQKVFAIRDRLTFFDESQNPVYFAAGSIFAIPFRLNITNNAGQEIIMVKKKLFRLFKTYALIDMQTKNVIGTVKRRFSFNKNFKVNINGESLLIKGSLLGFQFNLLNQQKESVLSVSKKYISWGDVYEIYIDETKINPEIACAVCVAFDNAVHNNKKKNN